MQIYVSGRPVNWQNPPDPTTFCTTDLICGDGRRFEGSFRTCVHMRSLIEECQRKFGVPLHVIQPPYNSSVAASAGTHDYDACSDVWIPGVEGYTAQAFLRARGFGCWFRHTSLWASPSRWHVHGFTLPIGRHFATRVGEWIPGQLTDYYNHAFGLVGMHTPGTDHTWFPENIDATIFKVNDYVARQQTVMKEKIMEYKDWSKQSKQEFVADLVHALHQSNDELLAREVAVRTPDGSDGEKISIRQAIARGANAVAVARMQGDRVVAAVEADDAANKN